MLSWLSLAWKRVGGAVSLLMRAPFLAILLALTAAGTSLAAPSGQDAFDETCGECHALAPIAGQTAPPLAGVVGRKIASAPDFDYSDALKAKAGTWTEANLDAFLTAPASFAPGTTMYASVPDAATRQAIIAYLKTQK